MKQAPPEGCQSGPKASPVTERPSIDEELIERLRADFTKAQWVCDEAADRLESLLSDRAKLEEAVEACRAKFVGYVELHKAKLPAGADAPAPADWRSIAEKIDRNQAMVDLCDTALNRSTDR